jgi:hypothetical protein
LGNAGGPGHGDPMSPMSPMSLGGSGVNSLFFALPEGGDAFRIQTGSRQAFPREEKCLLDLPGSVLTRLHGPRPRGPSLQFTLQP